MVVGGVISDTATLTSDFSPTGTITFKVFGPDNATCAGTPAFTSTATVNHGNGDYTSGSFKPTAAGTYRFVASYSGDDNNLAVSSTCNADRESVVVSSPASSIAKAQRDVTTGGDFVATTITAHPSDVLEYRLTYSNTGNGSATNVVVNDPIPARSTFLSCGNSCSHSASTVSWSLGTVAPGTVVLTFQVTLDSNYRAAAAAQQVPAAAVTLPKAGAGPQQQGSSAPGGGGPFGASGIVATLLLALIGSVLFALRRRQSAAAEEPKA